MKKVIVSELKNHQENTAFYLDLSERKLNHCCGCWTCWWKTPGKCIHKDLDDFYRSYVNADRAVFVAKLNNGFLSGNLKTLLDRMIPLFLPYTENRDGGTWHTKRYPKYPDVDFYYDYDFKDEEEYQIFHDYIKKVFGQFYSETIRIQPVSELKKEEKA